MDPSGRANRLQQLFVFADPAAAARLPLSAHGLIGDGHTAALVRADGAIDWLCLPRFHDPSVFAALVGPHAGGCAAVTPVDLPYESSQRYEPGTNVLQTTFRIPSRGVVRLTDAMPWTGDPGDGAHEIHRRVECVGGEAEVRVIFDPRFDYGRSPTTVAVEGSAAIATGRPGERLACLLEGDGRWAARPEGGVEARLRLRPAERRCIVIGPDVGAEAVDAERPSERLRSTQARWREWSAALSYDGPWRDEVVRSALVLKLLMYAPTGAMVAAPTTSLPEWIGGVRNWDYRYCWTRDGAMAARSALRLGFEREVQDFLHFFRNALERDPALEIMYAVDGTAVPEEQTLDHLAGHMGSAPVRIGNGARDQLQLDIAGPLLDAAHAYDGGGGKLDVGTRERLRAVVDTVATRWPEPDHGIWEPRAGKQHNLHSKLMSWVALQRGADLAARFGDEERRAQWASAANTLHAEVCERGLDPSSQRFVAAYGHEHPDAALLMLATQGFLPPEDPRIVRTVDGLMDTLGDGPFVHRYRVDDGVGGEEGAFILCGFWLAETLAMLGRLDEAERVFVAHLEASNHLGLLAEEVDPKTGAQLGNFPQAFSHLGLIDAATRIGAARRAREGAPPTRSAPT